MFVESKMDSRRIGHLLSEQIAGAFPDWLQASVMKNRLIPAMMKPVAIVTPASRTAQLIAGKSNLASPIIKEVIPNKGGNLGRPRRTIP